MFKYELIKAIAEKYKLEYNGYLSDDFKSIENNEFKMFFKDKALFFYNNNHDHAIKLHVSGDGIARFSIVVFDGNLTRNYFNSRIIDFFGNEYVDEIDYYEFLGIYNGERVIHNITIEIVLLEIERLLDLIPELTEIKSDSTIGYNIISSNFDLDSVKFSVEDLVYLFAEKNQLLNFAVETINESNSVIEIFSALDFNLEIFDHVIEELGDVLILHNIVVNKMEYDNTTILYLETNNKSEKYVSGKYNWKNFN